MLGRIIRARTSDAASPLCTCTEGHTSCSSGPTTITATSEGVTDDAQFRRALIDSTDIDRLNLGRVPTIKLDWYQPHEGNIVEWLYRARSFQSAA